MPHRLSRRHFLLQASALLTASTLQSNAVAQTENNDVLLGGCNYRDLNTHQIKFSLARVTPALSDIKQAATHFLPHGLAFTGKQKKYAFAFEKIGPGAGLFDIKNMQLLVSIPPIKGRIFYGHGVCNTDDTLLYSTETTTTGEGVIGVRETNSLQYIGDFPSYGQHPHECHLIENGSVLAVTNGGGAKYSGQPAAICYIDVQSQKLLDRIEMTDQRFNAGHMFPLAGRQSIVVSAPRLGLGDTHLGAVSIQRNNDTLGVISQPTAVTNNMLGESLSVLAIPAANLFVVSHPTPGMVTIWQLSTHKLIKRINLPYARGLALSRNQHGVWISYGKQAEIVRMNVADFSLGLNMPRTFITGSHLYTI